MKMLTALLVICGIALLTGCDRNVSQTVVVRTDVDGASSASVWLVEADNCAAQRINAGWYENGLWIFRLSTVSGGVGVVTQELALCAQAAAQPVRIWHSVHGGGAPLLLLSCTPGEKSSCRMYQDGYEPGMWSEDADKPSPPE